MTDAAAATALRLERSFDAARERVFEAWTSPEVLRRWWAAGRDWDTPHAEVDLRVGGRYRLSMRNPQSGDVHTVGGRYAEISPPERLVYSWAWEGIGDESRVQVDFLDQGGRTTVVVTHSELTGEEDRERHSHGWSLCLDNLAERVLR